MKIVGLISILGALVMGQEPQDCVIYRCGKISNNPNTEDYKSVVCGLYDNRDGIFQLEKCLSTED